MEEWRKECPEQCVPTVKLKGELAAMTERLKGQAILFRVMFALIISLIGTFFGIKIYEHNHADTAVTEINAQIDKKLGAVSTKLDTIQGILSDISNEVGVHTERIKDLESRVQDNKGEIKDLRRSSPYQ